MSVSALRALASGTVAVPQYQQYVEKAKEKATKEAEGLKNVKFEDPIHETENQTHLKLYRAICAAYVKHYPFLRVLSDQLSTFLNRMTEENEGFKRATTVVNSEELSKLEVAKEEFSSEYYTFVAAVFEARVFAQNFFTNVNHLNTKPLTFIDIEVHLNTLRKQELPEQVIACKKQGDQLQQIKGQRYQVAATLSGQVEKTMKVIDKNFGKVTEKLGLYSQTVTSGKGVPYKNTFTGALWSPLTKYDIPLPKGFTIRSGDISALENKRKEQDSPITTTKKEEETQEATKEIDTEGEEEEVSEV